MACNLLNRLVETCKKRGYRFVEATLQIGRYYKCGFDLDDITNEKIKCKFLFLRIINQDFYASANFAIDKIADIDSLIDITLDNRIPSERDIIDSLSTSSINKTKNIQSEPPGFLNIKLDTLSAWLKSESQSLAKKTGYKVYYISYIIEESDVFYRNSLGDFAKYSTSKSHFNGTIMNSSAGQIPYPVSFYHQDIVPYTPAALKICTPDLIKELSNTNISEFSKIKGQTHFHRDVISSIITGLASSFNIDLVLSGASFIKISDIDQLLFDSSVSLYDNPLEVDNGRIHFPFDLEGSKSCKKFLIKEGMVNDLLSDKEKSLKVPGLSPGNCFRVLPDIDLRILPSNLVLLVEKNNNNGMALENYIKGTGLQAFFDASTGRVKGTARGEKKIGEILKPTNFSLDFSIKDFFRNCLQVESYGWANGNYVPHLITDLSEEETNEGD